MSASTYTQSADGKQQRDAQSDLLLFDSLLFDAHCHLDFMQNAAEVAQDAAQKQLAIFATTVTPDCFQAFYEKFSSFYNVQVGMGFHPWWIADGRLGQKDILTAENFIQKNRFVGEIGLDFSDKHTPPESHAIQEEAFERICTVAAQASNPTHPHVLSVHSVKSATRCLDLLEQSGALSHCRCIFHWFSGTSDELHRAVQAGCWFSFNIMGLSTRRGREYAKQVPLAQLLCETDMPPGEQVPYAADMLIASLEQSIKDIAVSRTISEEVLRAALIQNYQRLMS